MYKLHNYQRRGADLFCQNKQGFANFCEMGTGKTCQAITALNELGFNYVIIACPKTLMLNWVKEFKIWNSLEYDIHIIEGTPKKKADTLAKAQTAMRSIVIISYDSIHNMVKPLQEFGAELIVADELHSIKGPNTRRSKAIKKLDVPCRWGLTGTPSPQSPLDYWSQMDFIKPGLFSKSYYAFRHRYAEVYSGGGFPLIKFFKNQTELRDKVKEISYRVTKEECLDLPDKVFQDIPVRLTAKNMALYKSIAEDLIAELGDEEVVTAQIILVKMLRLQQVTSGFVLPDEAEEVKEIGTEKLDALKDLLESAPNEKFVVWCKFRHEVKMIEAMLCKMSRSHVKLTGDTSHEDRQSNVDTFQTSEEPMIMIANIQVGGVGVTLTAARYSVFYSRSFSYGDYMQACDRVHRIGQEQKVTYYTIGAVGTIDEYITKLLNKKGKMSDHLTGDDLRRLVYG